MGFFEGLLGGALSRKGEIEQQNLAEAQRASAREQAIFGHLLNADDPEIRSLALTGLLESANPKKRKGGFRGWLGEMESSPLLPQIQSMLTTPVVESGTFQLPGEATSVQGPVEGLPTVKPTITQTPNAAAPLAQPSTSLVQQQPGATPPPQPQALLQVQDQTVTPPPQPAERYTPTAPPQPYTVSHPRQAFMSPMERFQQEAITKAGADVEGDVTAWIKLGMTRTQAIEQVRQERLRRGAGLAGQTYAEGEVTPDPLSPTGFSQTLWLRSDPTKTFKMPAQPPGYAVRSHGQDLESISMEPAFGGIPYYKQTPEGAARVNAEKQRREVMQAGAVTGAREAAQNLALTQRWLTPEQASELGVPIGSSMADIQGYTPLTEDQRKRKDAVVALAPEITKIETLLRKVLPPGMNAAQASALLAKKRTQKDPDFAALESAVTRAVGNVARVLAAEAGRLTQQDVERAQKSLVDLQGWADPLETALARVQDVTTSMDRILADLRTGGEPALRGPNGPPPPKNQQVPGLFMGADGQLHTGSPSGPVYTPGGAAPTPVPFTPQSIRPVR